MNYTQKLASISSELHSISANYIHRNETGMAKEFEDAAQAINHLVNVYNCGYEGDEIEILNNQVSQKIKSLHKVIKVKATNKKDETTAYILSSLNNYSSILATKQ